MNACNELLFVNVFAQQKLSIHSNTAEEAYTSLYF